MTLELTPIGVIHSPYQEQTGTPIQPRWAVGVQGTVELLPAFEPGLRDLEGFERIWLLCWLNRACKANMRVVPYLDTQPRGLFATRAPSRPNPIGLSCVRLLTVEGVLLRVAELDVLDGTPLLDIKPYIPDHDVFDVHRIGWYANGQRAKRADDRFAEPTSIKPK